jgi:hypothetical protein
MLKGDQGKHKLCQESQKTERESDRALVETDSDGTPGRSNESATEQSPPSRKCENPLLANHETRDAADLSAARLVGGRLFRAQWLSSTSGTVPAVRAATADHGVKWDG